MRREARVEPAARYREHRPPRSLAERLVCIWTQTVAPGEGGHTISVLPDGCADIVWRRGAPPVVAGPATRRVEVTLPAGTRLFGVRFRPGWVHSSLGLPADELLNSDVALADIWGSLGAQGPEPDWTGEADLGGFSRLLAALAARFSAAPAPDPVARVAVPWLARHPVGRIRELARLLGVSDRSLFRRIRAAVGYGPKTLQRILRFQRLLAVASADPPRLGQQARLALALSYADQAHMCREVREFSDRSPAALLGQARSALALAELFKTEGPSRE